MILNVRKPAAICKIENQNAIQVNRFFWSGFSFAVTYYIEWGSSIICKNSLTAKIRLLLLICLSVAHILKERPFLATQIKLNKKILPQSIHLYIFRSLIPLSAHTPHACTLPHSDPLLFHLCCGVTASIGARGWELSNG